MPSDHHKSKKKTFSIVLVPGEDVTEPRTYRFALWQFAGLLTIGVGLIVGSVIAILVYTRAGAFFPISNPELENKYNRELVALYQEVARMKSQLVELGSYNVKLRKALGESVVLTDTGIIRSERLKPVPEPGKLAEKVEQAVKQYEQRALELSAQQLTASASDAGRGRVSFPAVMPTQGYITRGYEPAQRHFGLDIAGKTGSTVSAAADGFVVFSGWTNDDGNLLIVSHANGFLTFYKHNQSLLKSANSFVKRGDPVASLGNSGRTSSGPHLHFEIWRNGTPMDPAQFILNINS